MCKICFVKTYNPFFENETILKFTWLLMVSETGEKDCNYIQQKTIIKIDTNV